MLLTIDIGNTVVTLGVFEGGQLKTTLRVATDTRRLADEYGAILTDVLRIKGVDPAAISSACLCSVVPPLTVVFSEVCSSFFGVTPLIVSAGVRPGLPILYDNPRDVGAGRLADAVAPTTPFGSPLMALDLCTATVFDSLTSDGV